MMTTSRVSRRPVLAGYPPLTPAEHWATCQVGMERDDRHRRFMYPAG